MTLAALLIGLDAHWWEERSEWFARLGHCCTRHKRRHNLFLVFILLPLVILKDQAQPSWLVTTRTLCRTLWLIENWKCLRHSLQIIINYYNSVQHKISLLNKANGAKECIRLFSPGKLECLYGTSFSQQAHSIPQCSVNIFQGLHTSDYIVPQSRLF